ESITDRKLESEIFVTCSEVLQGQWASITKLWESRRDTMLDMLVKAVPFTFRPAVQFCPTNTSVLSQALASGRFNEKIQADKKNNHIVNPFPPFLPRRELGKETQKD